MFKNIISSILCLFILQSCLQLKPEPPTPEPQPKIIKLQWSVPTANRITSYRLYILANDKLEQKEFKSNTNVCYLESLDLTQGVEYIFWVIALDGNAEGIPSNKITYIKEE